ncbi:DMT family transporter [Saccharomonospora sp. NPDC046836]|uniref:DMT family transporter n=1 Tax=Saccharomonospora sp. NPDC046836 TaxID=3156921 RepID=UPI0033EA19C5
MLTYLLAVMGACANAAASVLQRKANRDIPQRNNLSWRLIRELLHRPVWFTGVLAVIAGFGFQAAALSTGELSVVQPLLALDLPATLLLASVVFGARLHGREWGSVLAMTVGLAGLLYFLSPSDGESVEVDWFVWLAGTCSTVGLIGVLVGAAWWRQVVGDRRAALLGAAAGTAFGLTAAMMKGATDALDDGLVALFTAWQLYLMVAAGLLAMFLLQSAVNAGTLVATQPGLTLVDPIVAILWGVLAFGEDVRGGWFIVPEAISGALLVGAVLVLARSPLLTERTRTSPEVAAKTE